MPARRVKWRGFGVTVEIPERLAVRLRPRPEAPSETIRFAPVPRLNVVKHQPVEALRFFYNPDHDTESTGLDPARYQIPIEQARKLTNEPAWAEEIAEVTWYHTIDLPEGVVTPGEYDHRALVPEYGLPADLNGQRALDIGTNNGFWAFEFERRGAQVVAVDVDMISEIDYPPGSASLIHDKGVDIPVGGGFAVAHRLLDSKVEKVVSNVYALDPDRIGTFDFVHIADLLLHLRNPLAALERVRAVTSGQALIVDVFDPDLPDGVTAYDGGWHGVVWWRPSLQVLAQMVLDAGFASVEVRRVFNLAHEWGTGPWRAVLLARA
jgi:tRNA (mo5U34)-methyltransferase